jgi:hypothetical protein
MMRTFASEQSRIAFEGNLASTELFRLDKGSHEEVGILRRVTIAPQLDFVVLPLVPSRVPEIEKAIRSKVSFAESRGIVHVQIESDGEIAFGAAASGIIGRWAHLPRNIKARGTVSSSIRPNARHLRFDYR